MRSRQEVSLAIAFWWKGAQVEPKQSVLIPAPSSRQNFLNSSGPAFCPSFQQTFWRDSWSKNYRQEASRALSSNCRPLAGTTRRLGERGVLTKVVSLYTVRKTRELWRSCELSASRSGSADNWHRPRGSRKRGHWALSASKPVPSSHSAKIPAWILCSVLK